MSFERYLQHLERRLDVPYPARAELLVELAGHLDDLYAQHLAEGAPPDHARELAIRTLALDESFVSSIDSVHAPAVRSALAWLPAPVSLLVEHAGVGLVAIAATTLVLSQEVVMIEFFAEGGFFMIPLNLMGLAIVVLAGERAFSLWVKKDHSEANLRRRLLSLKFLGLGCALVGLIGTLVGYMHAFSAADRIIEQLGAFPIWEVSRIAFSTTVWGLTLALLALVCWYLVQATAVRIERMRLR